MVISLFRIGVRRFTTGVKRFGARPGNLMLRISTFNHLRYRISILFHSIGRVGPEQGDVLIVQVEGDASPAPDL
jgi:hypothetical protein